MAEIYHWAKLPFQIFKISEIKDVLNSGVFIFAGKNKSILNTAWTPYFVSETEKWEPYFIGETENFQELYEHPIWIKAKNKGATHIHILALSKIGRRPRVESLIAIYKPELNNYDQFTQSNPTEANMTNNNNLTEQLNETKSKLELLYQYEKHYLELIKEHKEEIKFANTLQEDLRRERTQFFTQTLKDVIQTMKSEEIDKTVSAQWIQDLVASYTKSIDLSGDLAKTHVIEILSMLTAETKREVSDAQLDSISKQADVK